MIYLVTSSTCTKAEAVAPLVPRELDAVFLHIVPFSACVGRKTLPTNSTPSSATPSCSCQPEKYFHLPHLAFQLKHFFIFFSFFFLSFARFSRENDFAVNIMLESFLLFPLDKCAMSLDTIDLIIPRVN